MRVKQERNKLSLNKNKQCNKFNQQNPLKNCKNHCAQFNFFPQFNYFNLIFFFSLKFSIKNKVNSKKVQCFERDLQVNVMTFGFF